MENCLKNICTRIEQNFFFRKLGLPYDYASPAEDFPLKYFANIKDCKVSQPNSFGFGSGFAMSGQNHCLLFDGYLLKIELGLSESNDEYILDRLIGGFIRLATIAPKSFLIRGLAADGRGFYANTCRESHIAWAFSLLRGIKTAAISLESQEKFKSIANKWFERLLRDRFNITSFDGRKVIDDKLNSLDPWNGIITLALCAVVALVNKNDKAIKKYEELVEQKNRIRLQKVDKQTIDDSPTSWMWRQIALSIIGEYETNSDRLELIKQRMLEVNEAVEKYINQWQSWDNQLYDLEPDLDWRNFPKENTKEPFSEFNIGAKLPESWRKLYEETNTIRYSLESMFSILLSGNQEFVEKYASSMRSCIETINWSKLSSLVAFSPVISVYTRGIELKLWDTDLADSKRVAPVEEMSFVAKYLEPDYDEKNQDKAGHSRVPLHKVQSKSLGNEANKRRRRKKRVHKEKTA